MQHLTKISLDACSSKINDGVLSLLGRRCQGLEDINLKGLTQLTSAGVSGLLSQIKRLVRLAVSPTMEDDALEPLPRHAASLRQLELGQNHALTDACLSFIGSCSRLETLELSGCMRLNDEALSVQLQKLTQLQHFRFAHSKPTKFGSASTTALAQCQDLRSVDLTNAVNITSAAFAELAASCTQLESVKLRGCYNLGDAAIEPLFLNCKGLEVLDLRFVHLVSLGGLNFDEVVSTSLRLLSFKYSQVSVNTTHRIQGRCPGCTIHLDPFVPEM